MKKFLAYTFTLTALIFVSGVQAQEAPPAEVQPPEAPQEYQVLIEMLMFEIQYENFKDLGLKYEWFPESGRVNRSILDLPLLSGTELINVGNVLKGEGHTEIVARLVQGKYGELHMTLKTLMKSHKARLLSQPRILTQLEKPATIATNEEIPYLVKGSTKAGFAWTYQQAEAGISVNVLAKDYNPETGFITLELKPSVRAHTSNVTIENLQMPIIEERSADVKVRIPSGSMYVIGGMFRDIEDESWEGVPVLSDIPVLGALFKSKHYRKIRSELVIFVTPIIIGLNETYAPAIDQPSRFGEWKANTPMPKETP